MKAILPVRWVPFQIFIITCGTLFLARQQAYSQATAPIKFGNSYVNLTKKTVGGTVQPGDTLEIRTNFYVRNTYNGTGSMYKVRYYDNLPTHTDTISTEYLRLITNEGLTSRQYTQKGGDDAGTFLKNPSLPGDYQIRINMGGAPFTADPTNPTGTDSMGLSNITGAANLRGNVNKPKFSSGSIITTAFRVRVTGSYGDTIVLGAGVIAYRTTPASSTDTLLRATQYKILISKPISLCSSTIGTNFAAENGGTFGHGTTLNRSAAPTFPIPNYTYLNNSGTATTINDGFYAIVNNVSPTSSTFAGARRQPNCNTPSSIPTTDPNSCNNREFGGFWFINGDHTGSVTAAGNAPPAAGADAGYMLLVNADLATSEAYRQTIGGLCPNTYYQFSANIMNVCPTCGIDSNSTSTYKPGVLPNLTFVVDGLDRYSSGQLDTVGWQKRGFVLLTGPSQYSITISLRNNAPGGGGNDWAMDDITLATCPPDLLLTPNKPDTLCQGADDTVRFKIASYVDNYTQWKLEQSTDGGTTWASVGVDTAGQPPSGTIVPNFDPLSGQYVNIISRYFRLYPINSFTKYRITVASTPANLSSSTCSFVTNSPKIVFGVDCNILLPTTLVSFRGQVREGLASLQWNTLSETADASYIIERSEDGQHFTPVGFIKGIAGSGGEATYPYTDPTPLTGPTYYRINITGHGQHRYSNQVLLSNTALGFGVKLLDNPFLDHVTLELTAPGEGAARLSLVDMYGRSVRQQTQPLGQGLNSLTLYGLGGLPNGTYVLQVRYADQVVSRKIVKLMK